MNTDITVSLDNFILYDTPHSSCDNGDYIGSPRVRTFTGKFLLGGNSLYERYNGLWVLKSVLVDDKLITDYSFEAVDILEEQILILSAFDKVVTIQFETLWEYFKLPSVAELNEISKQLTDRKIGGYHNPLKATYYTILDDGKTVLSFEDWEVEMNTLHTKWLFCERSRLTDSGYGKDTIEDYLSNRTFKEFLKKFYDDGIQFYSKDVEEDLPFAEVIVPQVQSEYDNSIEEMRLSTGLNERHQLNQIALPLSEYIDLMLRMTHTRLNTNAVIRHATVVHNYHHLVHESVPVVEDLTASVLPSVDYENARHSLTDFSALTLSDLVPEPTESIEDYLESLEGEVELPYEDILHYGTIIYNHHNGT